MKYYEKSPPNRTVGGNIFLKHIKQDPNNPEKNYRADFVIKDIEQETFISKQFLNENNVKRHRIIGQLFKTYWLIEYEDKLFIIDQHAAHEKVYFERMLKAGKSGPVTSQQVK